MIQAISGAIPPGMFQHDTHQIRERHQAEVSSPDPSRSRGRVTFEESGHEPRNSPKAERTSDQGHESRVHRDRVHDRSRFGDVVGAAVFADRVRMEQHAEFRAKMNDVETAIRNLMGEADGGVLTAEQQQTFDGFVNDIVDLRDSHEFQHRRSAGADTISARILDRFGVEAAPASDSDVADKIARSAEKSVVPLSDIEDSTARSAKRMAEIKADTERVLQWMTNVEANFKWLGHPNDVPAVIEGMSQLLAERKVNAERKDLVILHAPPVAEATESTKAAPNSVDTVLDQRPPILVQDAAPTDERAVVFADRARIGQRAEFRAEMHDIRRGIRDLVGKVDGRKLTPEQQQSFDEFVKEIADMRES